MESSLTPLEVSCCCLACVIPVFAYVTKACLVLDHPALSLQTHRRHVHVQPSANASFANASLALFTARISAFGLPAIQKIALQHAQQYCKMLHATRCEYLGNSGQGNSSSQPWQSMATFISTIASNA